MKNIDHGIEKINHVMYRFTPTSDPQNICEDGLELPEIEEWKYISRDDIDNLLTTNCDKCRKMIRYKVIRNE